MLKTMDRLRNRLGGRSINAEHRKKDKQMDKLFLEHPYFPEDGLIAHTSRFKNAQSRGFPLNFQEY